MNVWCSIETSKRTNPSSNQAIVSFVVCHVLLSMPRFIELCHKWFNCISFWLQHIQPGTEHEAAIITVQDGRSLIRLHHVFCFAPTSCPIFITGWHFVLWSFVVTPITVGSENYCYCSLLFFMAAPGIGNNLYLKKKSKASVNTKF